MTDKDRVRHLLDLAAEEIPDTINLWSRIRDKAAQTPIFEDKASMTPLHIPRSAQPTTLQRGRTRPLSVMTFAVTCAVLILGGLVLLNKQNPSGIEEPLYGSFPMGTPVSEVPVPEPSLQVVSRLGQGKAIEAVWSPDGKQMFVVGSMGLWIYDAADLTAPIENIYSAFSFTRAPAFSRDSTHLAFLDGRDVHIWDLIERREITFDLFRETKQPQSVALNPDATRLAVGDLVGNVHFYDIQTQKLLSSAQITQSPTPISNVEFNAQGTILALTGQSSPFFILEDPTGEWSGNLQYLTLPVEFDPPIQDAPLGAIAYSGDGSHLVGRFNDSLSIWEWEGQTLQKMSRIDLVDSGGRLVMNQDGSQVAILSEFVSVWDIKQDSSSHIMLADDPENAVMNLNADWSRIAIVDSLGSLRVKDVDTGEEIMSTDAYTMGRINGIALSVEGSQMVTDDETGQIRVWNTTTLTDIPASYIAATRALASVSVAQPAMSVESQLALPTVFGTDKKIELWDLTAAGSTALIERFNSTWPIPSEFLSGTYAATSTEPVAVPATLIDGTWQATTATIDPLIYTLATESDLMTASALNPYGQTVAVGLASEPMEGSATSINPVIVTYDVETGEEIITLSGHEAPITSLVYSPDGTQLLSNAGDGFLKLWDLATGEVLHSFPIHGPFPAAFSPDGMLIAGIDWNENFPGSDLVLWDAATGEEVLRIHDETRIERVVFHPDGQHLVTGSSNGLITFWNVSR